MWAWRDRQLRVVMALLLLTLLSGTLFYSVVEHWTLLDAAYFSVVTLATVGFGDLTPVTAVGKVFTMAYLFVGIGLLAAFANAIARRWVDRRLRHIKAPGSTHHLTAIHSQPRRHIKRRPPSHSA
jgi:voltage-gated potassium channel